MISILDGDGEGDMVEGEAGGAMTSKLMDLAKNVFTSPSSSSDSSLIASCMENPNGTLELRW